MPICLTTHQRIQGLTMALCRHRLQFPTIDRGVARLQRRFRHWLEPLRGRQHCLPKLWVLAVVDPGLFENGATRHGGAAREIFDMAIGVLGVGIGAVLCVHQPGGCAIQASFAPPGTVTAESREHDLRLRAEQLPSRAINRRRPRGEHQSSDASYRDATGPHPRHGELPREPHKAAGCLLLSTHSEFGCECAHLSAQFDGWCRVDKRRFRSSRWKHKSWTVPTLL